MGNELSSFDNFNASGVYSNTLDQTNHEGAETTFTQVDAASFTEEPPQQQLNSILNMAIEGTDIAMDSKNLFRNGHQQSGNTAKAASNGLSATNIQNEFLQNLMASSQLILPSSQNMTRSAHKEQKEVISFCPNSSQNGRKRPRSSSSTGSKSADDELVEAKLRLVMLQIRREELILRQEQCKLTQEEAKVRQEQMKSELLEIQLRAERAKLRGTLS